PELAVSLFESPPAESSRVEVKITGAFATPIACNVPLTTRLTLPLSFTICPGPTVSITPAGTVMSLVIRYTMSGLFQLLFADSVPPSMLAPLKLLFVIVTPTNDGSAATFMLAAEPLLVVHDTFVIFGEELSIRIPSEFEKPIVLLLKVR